MRRSRSCSQEDLPSALSLSASHSQPPADLLPYLFGTIIGINDNDMYFAAGLGMIVLVVMGLLWKEWVAITLDTDFARSPGCR